jgi:D-tyrosyl-tRNA(Tyr) deacylase
MRVVIQRVSSASVTIAGRVAGQITRGLLVFVGIEAADTAADGEWLAAKVARLRVFADENGQMNLSLQDLVATEAGSPSSVDLAKDDALRPRVLLISQFTLHASTQKGARPSFNQAARPELARPLYEQFVTQLSTALGGPTALSGVERVATGEFGAHMDVALVNDGPVTLIIDSKVRE